MDGAAQYFEGAVIVTAGGQIDVLQLSADGHWQLRFAFDGERFRGAWVRR